MENAKTAVILAAGEGKRMRPLTYTMPKPMLPIGGRPMLQYLIMNFREAGIRHIVLVTGYKKESIENYFGKGDMLNVDIDYVEQKNPQGTAHAFEQAKDLVSGRFIATYGDQLIDAADVNLIRAHERAIGAAKVENPSRYGVLKVNSGYLETIVEKPENPPSNLINAGIYSFKDDVFDFIKRTPKSPRGEVEITDTVQLMTDEGKRFKVVELDYWRDIGYPWQMLQINEEFMKTNMYKIEGIVEDGVVIRGNVKIGKGTRVRAGSYIQGPISIGRNCEIGPACYLRDNTVVRDNCRIGRFVEIKNSIIMSNTKIQHHSYVGDSVIGADCNFGAGTKCANLRFDDKTVKMKIKDEVMDSERRKMGIIMGTGTKTGLNCVMMPGVKIGNNARIGPNAIIYEDVPNDVTVMVEQKLKQFEHEKKK